MSFFRPNRRSSMAVLSTLLMATQLAGCGGGNGGTTAPPAGPPIGNPNPDPPVVPGPTLSSLTLTGTVTDAPIANAVVTATVGDETFTANADANGNYSLDIEVEPGATTGFVTLSARGVGPQSYVEFTSLAGTFASLKAQAGADETLSNTENFATQITNVSTAQAVLLQEANGGEPVNTEALLATLSATINSQEVLDLATAIKLLVDDAANYPMPNGATSLLTLISTPVTRAQFVDDTYDQSPTTFASTQTAIVTDTTLTQPVSSETLPASLTAALLSNASDFSFNYVNRVNSYEFNSDGTGSAATGQWGTDMTWAIAGSGVDVTYASTIHATSFDYFVCNGTRAQHEADYASNGVKLTLLSDRMLAITETSTVTFVNLPPGCTQEPFDVTTTVARTIVNDDDFQPIVESELRGSIQSIYVYDQDAGVTADVAELDADGTGLTWAFAKEFTWALDATGREVTITFTDGTVGKYRQLAQIDDVLSDLMYEITTPTGVRIDAGASVYSGPEEALAFTPENLLGRFYLFGVGLEGASGDARVKSFRLRFDADGTGSHEDDFINDDNELVTLDDSSTPNHAFHWHIDAEEDVIVKRSFDPVALQDNCAPGTPDCIVYDERRLIPLALIDTRAYWMEYRLNDFYGVDDDTVPTTLIRYYDYEPFSAGVIGNSKPTASTQASARQLRFRGATQR